MNKLLALLTSVALPSLLMLGFSSCKDDDEKPKISTVTFVNAEKAVGEGESNIEAKITLDRPASSSVVISYTLSGSAVRKIGNIAGDYEVVGGAGDVEIPAGETTASIVFNILQDNVLEGEERIVITLDDASVSTVEIGTDDQMDLVIAGGGSVTASFTNTTLTVNEADEGVHEIQVQISEAASSDVIITYDLKAWSDAQGNYIPGTAIDSVSAFDEGLPSDYYDYFIDGDAGQVTIPAGSTSAMIRVNVLSDFLWEVNETFDITLKTSDNVTVGASNKITVTVVQENGKIVELSWPDGTDVDMDMFLWFEGPADGGGTDFYFVAWGVNPSTDGPELRIIPDVFSEILLEGLEAESVTYGASYVYYEGTEDPLNFQVAFANFADGTETLIETKQGVYTANNINPWDDDTNGTAPQIEQTFVYSNGTLSNISEIDPPDNGSRVKELNLPGRRLKEHFVRIPTQRSIK